MDDFWKDFTVVDAKRPDLGGNCRRGDAKAITPRFWEYLVSRFAPQSMLDVGCGEGHALAAFRRLGVVAHGIDGLIENARNARHPIAVHDLTTGPYLYPCDLVLCVEVVEHLAETHIANLMATLTNAPVVVMTHGGPGQPGHHHVNLQPAEYWIARFSKRGYHLAPDNAWLKSMAQAEAPGSYFGATGLVFIQP
jgi:SAM-dependent methyltransferase